MNIQCLVVGGGPAGIAAAAEAARWGTETILVEAHSALDQSVGVYNAKTRDLGDSEENFTERVQELNGAGATVLRESLAWAVFEDGAFGVVTPSQSMKILPNSTILATGAYERLLPFPGWHLPNVMSPSEALTFSRRRRGSGTFRWLVAGAAGLGIDVAKALRASGAEVVALVEADRGFETRNTEVENLKVLPGYTVAGVMGNEGVKGVEVAPVDGDGPSYSYDANGICVALGRIPMGDLAQVAGCEMEFMPERGGYVPTYDSSLATSVEGVFVAGDIAGLCTVATAIAEGRLAGLMAANRVERAISRSFEERKEELIEEVRRGRNADADRIRIESETIQRLEDHHVRLALDRDDVFLCRCPQTEILGKTILYAITEGGAETPTDLKRFTQAGMGECQGRMCRPLLDRAIALLGPRKQTRLPSMALSYRPPVRPVPLPQLLADEGS